MQVEGFLRPAHLAIENELALLEAEIEGFILSPPSVHARAPARYVRGLKMRAALYDVRPVHVRDIEKTLADLAGSVETLLNEKAAA